MRQPRIYHLRLLRLLGIKHLVGTFLLFVLFLGALPLFVQFLGPVLLPFFLSLPVGFAIGKAYRRFLRG